MIASVRSFFLAAVTGGVLATGAALLAPATVQAADGKNLKVLPAGISKADIKKLMKAQAAALGVQCDFCHDTDDYAKDTEKKEVGRSMMKMTAEIDKAYFKGQQKVGCITCHDGKKEAKKPAKL